MPQYPAKGDEQVWRVVSVPFTAITAGFSITTMDCRVLSYNFEESTGAASAVVDIYDGTNTGGIRLRRIALASGQSKEGSIDPPYVPTLAGLWINVTSGSVSGTITIAIPE